MHQLEKREKVSSNEKQPLLTYIVSSGTLNPTIPIVYCVCVPWIDKLIVTMHQLLNDVRQRIRNVKMCCMCQKIVHISRYCCYCLAVHLM